jgi:hypothetical protein
VFGDDRIDLHVAGSKDYRVSAVAENSPTHTRV